MPYHAIGLDRSSLSPRSFPMATDNGQVCIRRLEYAESVSSEQLTGQLAMVATMIVSFPSGRLHYYGWLMEEHSKIINKCAKCMHKMLKQTRTLVTPWLLLFFALTEPLQLSSLEMVWGEEKRDTDEVSWRCPFGCKLAYRRVCRDPESSPVWCFFFFLLVCSSAVLLLADFPLLCDWNGGSVDGYENLIQFDGQLIYAFCIYFPAGWRLLCVSFPPGIHI